MLVKAADVFVVKDRERSIGLAIEYGDDACCYFNRG